MKAQTRIFEQQSALNERRSGDCVPLGTGRTACCSAASAKVPSLHERWRSWRPLIGNFDQWTMNEVGVMVVVGGRCVLVVFFFFCKFVYQVQVLKIKAWVFGTPISPHFFINYESAIPFKQTIIFHISTKTRDDNLNWIFSWQLWRNQLHLRD